MSNELFEEGGPYKIKKTGPDQHTFQIPFETDENGRVARECPNPDCSPGYFKVKYGTGILEADLDMSCPYCRTRCNPSEFMTKEQLRYGEEILTREAMKGMDKMMKKALGIGPSGKKKYGGGMFSMEMTYKPGRPPQVHHPFEEEVQRDIVCPHCGLNHAVFGLAVWCPDCDRDIFMTHVQAEFAVVRSILGAMEGRKDPVAPRVEARNLENCLEDTVSIFEASLKAMLLRSFRESNRTEEDIEIFFKKNPGNPFQNLRRAAEIIRREMNQELFDGVPEKQIAALTNTFEKRHPITHNLGVVDKKYLQRASARDREGKDIRVTKKEIEEAISLCLQVLASLHDHVFAVQSSAGDEATNSEIRAIESNE